MKTKTKQEIANEYKVCVKTLNKWLKQNSVNAPRGLIYPNLQSKIYNELGKPESSD